MPAVNALAALKVVSDGVQVTPLPSVPGTVLSVLGHVEVGGGPHQRYQSALICPVGDRSDVVIVDPSVGTLLRT